MKVRELIDFLLRQPPDSLVAIRSLDQDKMLRVIQAVEKADLYHNSWVEYPDTFQFDDDDEPQCREFVVID